MTDSRTYRTSFHTELVESFSMLAVETGKEFPGFASCYRGEPMGEDVSWVRKSWEGIGDDQV